MEYDDKSTEELYFIAIKNSNYKLEILRGIVEEEVLVRLYIYSH